MCPPPPTCLTTTGPLGEMTREIVKVVLSQCGGNQTLAAKRLGIGRTTLWRYLNETD